MFPDFISLIVALLTVISFAWVLNCFWSFVNNELKVFVLAIVAGSIFLILSLSTTPKPLNHYYFNSMASVPAILIGMLLGCSGFILCQSKTYDNKVTKFLSFFSAGFLILVILSSAVVGMYKSLDRFANKPFPAHLSLLHSVELSKIIQNDLENNGMFRLFSRGKDRSGRNPVYYFLGKKYFPGMQQASYFKELEYFRKNKRTKAEVAYLEVCPKSKNKPVMKKHKKLNKVWTDEQPVSTQSCKACKACELYRLASLKIS